MESKRTKSSVTKGKSVLNDDLLKRLENEKSVSAKLNLLQSEFKNNDITPELMSALDRVYLEMKAGGFHFHITDNIKYNKLLDDVLDTFAQNRFERTLRLIEAVSVDEIAQASEEDRGKRKTPVLNVFLDDQENLSNWFLLDVMSSRSKEEAKLKLERWAKIIEKLIKLGDIPSAIAVHSYYFRTGVNRLIDSNLPDHIELSPQALHVLEFVRDIKKFKQTLEGKDVISPLPWWSQKIANINLADENFVVNIIDNLDIMNAAYNFLYQHQIGEGDIQNLISDLNSPQSLQEILQHISNKISSWNRTIEGHKLTDKEEIEFLDLIDKLLILVKGIKIVPETDLEKHHKQMDEIRKTLIVNKINFPLNEMMSWLNQEIATKEKFNFTREEVIKNITSLIKANNPSVDSNNPIVMSEVLLKSLAELLISNVDVDAFNKNRTHLHMRLIEGRGKGKASTKSSEHMWTSVKKSVNKQLCDIMTHELIDRAVSDGLTNDPSLVEHLKNIVTNIKEGKTTNPDALNIDKKGNRVRTNYKKEIIDSWGYTRALQIMNVPQAAISISPESPTATIERPRTPKQEETPKAKAKPPLQKSGSDTPSEISSKGSYTFESSDESAQKTALPSDVAKEIQEQEVPQPKPERPKLERKDKFTNLRTTVVKEGEQIVGVVGVVGRQANVNRPEINPQANPNRPKIKKEFQKSLDRIERELPQQLAIKLNPLRALIYTKTPKKNVSTKVSDNKEAQVNPQTSSAEQKESERRPTRQESKHGSWGKKPPVQRQNSIAGDLHVSNLKNEKVEEVEPPKVKSTGYVSFPTASEKSPEITPVQKTALAQEALKDRENLSPKVQTIGYIKRGLNEQKGGERKLKKDNSYTFETSSAEESSEVLKKERKRPVIESPKEITPQSEQKDTRSSRTPSPEITASPKISKQVPERPTSPGVAERIQKFETPPTPTKSSPPQREVKGFKPIRERQQQLGNNFFVPTKQRESKPQFGNKDFGSTTQPAPAPSQKGKDYSGLISREEAEKILNTIPATTTDQTPFIFRATSHPKMKDYLLLSIKLGENNFEHIPFTTLGKIDFNNIVAVKAAVDCAREVVNGFSPDKHKDLKHFLELPVNTKKFTAFRNQRKLSKLANEGMLAYTAPERLPKGEKQKPKEIERPQSPNKHRK